MRYSEEQVALCALNKIYGYHPSVALQLMELAGGAAALFAAPLPKSPVHPELWEQITPSALEAACRELEKVESRGFRFIGWGDADYPSGLEECPEPPLGLYLNGTSSPAEIFGLRPMVGVVGTRDISLYGKAWCAKLVEALASASIQPCIVSGLALGTDGIAHQTALEQGLPTIGVMATGIDKVYPWQHERLAMKMVESPGSALLTDYPLGTSPVALNFVRRNRIIAGLVSGVIVVESKTRGGSLMTAKYACEYSRDVFALPGRVDDVRSAGCNSLIRENMAEIITTPEDLVARLGLGGSFRRGAGSSWVTGADGFRASLERRYGSGPDPQAASASPALLAWSGADAVRLGMAVYEQRGIGPEELAAQLGLPIPRVLELIGLLEADGFIATDLLRRCSALSRR